MTSLLTGLRNGTWLDSQDFPPLAYVVPGVIPEGSVLLVGPPKIGKSWFVLTIALAAATGGKMLGLDVPSSSVLYLALEDGDRRLQDRCRKLLAGGPIPSKLEYLTRVEPGQVLETIREWLELQHHQPLVILDTLGKVMPPAMQGESSYQRDYRVGTALKHLADQQPGMTLLVNHHDRKADAADFVDAVSATHGLAGAADTIVVLTRPRLEEHGLIKVTGRDIPEAEYAVRFRDGHHWSLDGNNLSEAASTARASRATAGLGNRAAELVEAVTTMGQATPKDLADELGMEPNDVRTYLTRLVEGGRLIRVKRGIYAAHGAPTGGVASVAGVAKDGAGTPHSHRSHTPIGDPPPTYEPDDPARWTR